MEKRGQVALFVVVALIILSVLILFIAYPRLRTLTTDVDPTQYMQNCLEPALKEVLPVLAAQGGYYQPTHYTVYKGEKIEYLCYTTENYKPCIVQQPLLIRHVSKEIESYVQPKAQQCLASIKTIYEKQGYSVSNSASSLNVSLVPGKIAVEFNAPLVLMKDNKQTFRKFTVSESSELYDLLVTATSIIQFESTLGDSETSLYLQFYPNLKIEKIKRDADTVYILTNVITEDSFTFATRSLVWPPGIGLR